MKIQTVRMGITRCYIIQDKGTIMVDSGPPNKLGVFTKSLQKASINPKQIKLIVLTHGHWDHIGSAKVIKETTGAQVALHEPDKTWLEKSLNQLPPGATTWGSILMKLTSNYMRSAKIAATTVDIVLQDEDFTLASFGISGRVVYTPGHTMGSVSILLDSGDAFIGDLAMNGLPFNVRPGLPVFAEDIKRVKESCTLLLDKGAKTFYPGHGKPFSANLLQRFLR
jgi:hydroxyacylglutathione hydrolase